MANAADMADDDPARILLVGYPGSGKTGAISALLNVGYKVRLIDFEGNYKPLLTYTDKRALANLDILTFQDTMMDSGSYFDTAGVPTAFNGAIKSLQDWKTVDSKGEPVSLGPVSTWGPDTVLVIDSLTRLGVAAFLRARKMMNKTPKNTTAAVWGAAVDDQVEFIRKVNKRSNKFHTIFLGHLAMIGPKTPMSSSNEDDDLKDLKMQIATEAASLMDTRLYPKAITQNSSRDIAGNFPTMLLAERKTKAMKVNRFITTVAGEELDLKLPVRNAAPDYPIETGLATIFDLLGAKAPGFEGK